PASRRASRWPGRLLPDQLLVDDLDLVADLVGGGLRVVEGARVAALQLHLDHVLRDLVLLLLDLVARIGPARGARDGGGRVAAPAADLVAEHAAHDSAHHGASAAGFALLRDRPHAGHRAA